MDLSIGSTIGLVGSLLASLLTVKGWSICAALATVMLVSLGVGLAHGLLITKLRLQPFVVTLCGLLIYRGLARFLTDDQSQGFGNSFEGLRALATGKITLPFGGYAVPYPLFIMVTAGILAAIFLNRTIYGRYLLALGRNETAARYSGINTDAMKIIAYVICSGLAGVAGILFSLNLNSVQPSGLGEFYELYAIAGAVLGGCSLRGGEGSILGVVIGSAVMRVLYNSINILRIPTHWEFAIIGAVILSGVIVDELVKRIAARRRSGRP
jgi:ribose transport system permease protein